VNYVYKHCNTEGDSWPNCITNSVRFALTVCNVYRIEIYFCSFDFFPLRIS
jgi:hypothetical protein